MNNWVAKCFITLILFASPREIYMPGTGSQSGPQRIASFVGQIMDSKCATTGSHESNIKKLDAKNARDCTMKCARNGSFVLYVPGAQSVYQLDNQEKPAPFAGERVKISGQYDDWTQTIEIESIGIAP